jgi:hypothetical protein
MSKDSILVIVLWIILSALAIGLWAFTVNTEQAVFYTHYFSFIQIVTSMGAAFLCYRAMKVFEPVDKTSTAWGFLSLGLLFWSVGAILEGFYPLLNNGVDAPFPWYADVGFLMLTPFAIMGLITFRTNLNVNIPLWGWIATTLVLLGALSLALWINAKGFQELSTMAFVITMAYIIFDSILLAMTVAIASILVGGLLSRPWWFALAGLFAFYLGDVTYTFIRNINEPNAGGVMLDLMWPLAFGLIALAATTARAIYKCHD